MMGYGYYNPIADAMTVLSVIFFLSLIGAIVLLIAFLPKSKQYQYSGFTKSLYNFLNFNTFWLSPIIKLMYMTLACTFILGGLIVLFMVPVIGLGLIIFGVILRLFFEMGYIMYAMLDQLILLNKKFEPQAESEQPDGKKCAQCGAAHNPGNIFCQSCGTKL